MAQNFNEQPKGDVQTAIEAGMALGQPQTVLTNEDGSGAYVIVPEDCKVEDLEQFQARPRRIDQRVELQDTDSLIAYVKEFRDQFTHIFFSVEGEEFTAIFDYHEFDPPRPNWCNHTASFKPRRSVEFTTWMNQNRKQMTQVDFARFLEDNMPDIPEPPSAHLLAVALTFEAKKSVEFSSGVRLAN